MSNQLFQNSSQEIEQAFVEQLSATGQNANNIINAWKSRILPNVTPLGSPRYFDFVNGSGSMISVLADALATSVYINAAGWKADPATK